MRFRAAAGLEKLATIRKEVIKCGSTGGGVALPFVLCYAAGEMGSVKKLQREKTF